jgi:hypothetical protein
MVSVSRLVGTAEVWGIVISGVVPVDRNMIACFGRERLVTGGPCFMVFSMWNDARCVVVIVAALVGSLVVSVMGTSFPKSGSICICRWSQEEGFRVGMFPVRWFYRIL